MFRIHCNAIRSFALTKNLTRVRTPLVVKQGRVVMKILMHAVVVSFSSIFLTEVRCWNGECVSNFTECRPLPACPDTLPKKCPDSTCIAANATCSVGSCDLTNSILMTFSYSRKDVICPDGSCQPKDEPCYSWNGCLSIKVEKFS